MFRRKQDLTSNDPNKVPVKLSVDNTFLALTKGAEKVNLDETPLTRTQCYVLSDALFNSNHIRCVGLMNCGLTDNTFQIVFQFSGEQSSLEWIGLYGNQLTDISGKFILRMLQVYPLLGHMNLGGNKFTPDMELRISQTLQSKQAQILALKEKLAREALPSFDKNLKLDRDWAHTNGQTTVASELNPVVFHTGGEGGSEAKVTGKRIDINVPQSRVCMIDNFLSEQDAKSFLDQANSLGYSSLSKEFLPTYRNNERCVVYSPQLSDLLYEKLQLYLVKEDVEGVTPFGFDNKGKWVPKRLGAWWKFSKYEENTFFKPHMDSSYVVSPQERSIYTLMIFLNEDCEGGLTSFFPRETNLKLAFDEDSKETPKPLVKIKPRTGRALLFNHDTVHAGETVTKGCKYIMRTELLFERTSSPENPNEWMHNVEYQRTRALYQESDRLEAAGRIAESCRVYLTAMETQSAYGSLFQQQYQTKGAVENTKKWPLHQNEATHVFSYLTIAEIVRLSKVCLLLLSVARDSSLWQSLYQRQFANTSGIEKSLVSPGLYNSNNSNKQASFLKDWYASFKQTYYASTKFRAIVLDLGQQNFKFGMVGINQPNSFENLVALEPSVHYNHLGADEEQAIRVGKRVLEIANNHYSSVIEVGHIVYEGEIVPENLERALKYVYSRGFSRNTNYISYSLSGAYGSSGSDKIIEVPRHPVLVASPLDRPSWPQQQQIQDVLFARGVPFVGFADAAVLVLAAFGLRTGVVVGMGQQKTVIVVVKDGKRLATNAELPGADELLPAGIEKRNERYLRVSAAASCAYERVDLALHLKHHKITDDTAATFRGFGKLRNHIDAPRLSAMLFEKGLVQKTLSTIKSAIQTDDPQKAVQLRRELLSKVVLSGGLCKLSVEQLSVETQFAAEMNQLLALEKLDEGVTFRLFSTYCSSVVDPEQDVVLGGLAVCQTSSCSSLFATNPAIGASLPKKKTILR